MITLFRSGASLGIALLVMAVPRFSFSQATNTPQKIGHADWEYIFSKLPDYKRIEAELKTFENHLQQQLRQKTAEFENKYKLSQNLPPDTPDAIRRDKQSELAYLQENIQKFREDAEASLRNKQSELITPVFAKIGKAVEEVAVENGYAYIVNPQMMGGGDVLLYANDAYNISHLVLKKLGAEDAITD
jgi:outer membrane protein